MFLPFGPYFLGRLPLPAVNFMRHLWEDLPESCHVSNEILSDRQGRRPFPNDPILRTEKHPPRMRENEHTVYADDYKGFICLKFCNLDVDRRGNIAYNWKEIKEPQ